MTATERDTARWPLPSPRPGGSGVVSPARVRSARRAARHAFRPHRTVPATVAAIVLTAIAVLAAAEVISALVGRPLHALPYQAADGYLRTATWRDPPVLAACVVLMLVGLGLILLALVPGRPRWVAVETADPDLVVGLSPGAVRRALAAAAESVWGVRSAKVRLAGTRALVVVSTDLRTPDRLRSQVREAVRGRVTALAPARPLHVSVKVRTRRTARWEPGDAE
ncbi:DUF6286 domain-containing protein [Allonocardiopsis opalescens]|uniref:DUF6286 domain-containing protein n=1 Tax=Allonocardiopsis opalescens TaxID=1144618 RepID=A0A2T0PW25_9ACTN|nr:DUF6286 domain-containing protein [Allonocardiopsis opalescens]PRX95744.1 hypothetical protein CLV72_109357 [Allonocardiopsis opalescens]